MEASSSQNGDTTAAEAAGPSDPFPSASILATEDDMDTEDMQQRLNRVLQVDIVNYVIYHCIFQLIDFFLYQDSFSSCKSFLISSILSDLEISK